MANIGHVNEAIHWLNKETDAEQHLKELSNQRLKRNDFVETGKLIDQYDIELRNIETYRKAAQVWIDKVVKPYLEGL